MGLLKKVAIFRIAKRALQTVRSRRATAAAPRRRNASGRR